MTRPGAGLFLYLRCTLRTVSIRPVTSSFVVVQVILTELKLDDSMKRPLSAAVTGGDAVEAQVCYDTCAAAYSVAGTRPVMPLVCRGLSRFESQLGC